MIDIELLKQTISLKEKGIDDVASAIGMDKSTFYRRLASGGKDFSIAEVEGICNYLKLTKKERKNIFFARVVA
jgi:hypothetical protein